MNYKFTYKFSIIAVVSAAFMLFINTACQSDSEKEYTAIGIRDSLPILKSIGVSTLISDSGIIQYKIISEDWFIYDKKEPSFWSFEKGLFIEKYDKNFKVETFISCDTAYYFDKKKLWELRGRVFVKNLKGESFKTTLLYWDQVSHEIYSDHYMQINGENKLDGYNFRSNEQMTDYRIYSSKGNFPFKGDSTPANNASDSTFSHNNKSYNDTTVVNKSNSIHHK